MKGPTGSQSQGYWKAHESKSSFSGLRKCIVPAMPEQGAVFDPSCLLKGLGAGTHLSCSPGEAETGGWILWV